MRGALTVHACAPYRAPRLATQRSLVVISKATTPSVALGTVYKHISTAWLLRAMCVRAPAPTPPILRDYEVFYDAFEAVSTIYAALTIFESVVDETRSIAQDDRYLILCAPIHIKLRSYVLHSLVAGACMGFGVAHIYTMGHVELRGTPPQFAPFVPQGDDAAVRKFFFGAIDTVSGCTLASSSCCWLLFFQLIIRRGRHMQPTRVSLLVTRACIMFNLLQQFFNSLLLGMTLAADNVLRTVGHDMSFTPWWGRMQMISTASFVCTTITQIHFQFFFMPEVAM